MGNKSLDTHFYDGKLHTRFTLLKDELKDKDLPSIDLCKDSFLNLINISNLNPKQKIIAINMTNLLFSKNDIDTTNNIAIYDLIPLVWFKVKDYDDSAKKLFLEQLIDINKGQCIQGRVARLIQLV
jgi:hypothetical protein